jgi:hypothetical protein
MAPNVQQAAKAAVDTATGTTTTTTAAPSHAPGTTEAQLAANQEARLVQSKSGVYVETEEYDPTGHHRARGRTNKANRGEGLCAALCPCFGRGARRASEHAAKDVAVDRHYEAN